MTTAIERLVIVVGNKGNLATHIALAAEDKVPVLKTNSLIKIKRALEITCEVDIIYTSFYKAKEPEHPEDIGKYVRRTMGLLSDVICTTLRHKAKVRSFIYCSSASVYGNMPDTVETGPVNPLSFYGHMKLSCERVLTEMMTGAIPSVVVARIFNIYGGLDRTSIVYRIKNSLRYGSQLSVANEGKAVRDFIHVKDVASILLHLRDASAFSGIVNVGTGVGVSVAELIARAEIHCKKRIPTRYYSQVQIGKSVADICKLSTYWDMSLLRSVIGYMDSVDTEG